MSSARGRAKKKGLEIDLDKTWVDDHLVLMKCEATGVDLTLDKEAGVEHSPFRPSIDRIDNSRVTQKTIVGSFLLFTIKLKAIMMIAMS